MCSRRGCPAAMALAEVPVNVAGRNAKATPWSKPLREVNGQVAEINDNAKATSVPDPSSIQSMLKNTTEIGDLDQFPIKHIRKPPSAFKPSSGYRHEGSAVSRRHHRGPRGPRPFDENDFQHPSTPSRHGSTTSSIGSSLLSQGSRSFRAHPGGHDGDDGSWSMTQKSYASHALATRHPYLNHGYQTKAIGPTGRPRSPFAYPTRLKRPGYRPSSPAQSEIHHAHYGSGLSPREASPASMHSVKRSPVPWQQYVNHSDPMLRHYASLNGNGPAYQQSISPSSSHPSTPRPTPSLRSVGSSSRLPRTQLSMTNMWTHHESAPARPLFYDYSEEFEDVRRPMHPNTSAAAPYEQSQSYNGENIAIKSDLAHAEVKPIQALGLQDKVFVTPTKSSIQRGASDLIRTRKSIVFPASEALEPRPSTHEANKRFTTGTFISAHKAKQLLEDGRTLAITSSNVATDPIRAEFSHWKPGQKSGTTLSVRPSNVEKKNISPEASLDDQEIPSSSDGSMRTAESNSYLEGHIDIMNPTSTNPSPISQPKTPAIASGEAGDRNLHLASPKRRSILGSHSVSEPTEIFSPTPERSVTSPNSRRRFSKILGLDDSSVEVDVVGNTSHQSNDLTVKNGLKSPTPVRDSLANNDTVNTSILQLSDSDEEHDFSPSLMQTFGRRSERHEPKDSGADKDRKPDKRRPTSPEPSTTSHTARIASQDSPGLCSSDSETSLPELDTNKTKNRHAQIFMSNSKPILRVDKELPSVPEEQRSFVSIPPPIAKDKTDLPFDFAPLTQHWLENESLAELEAPSALPIKAMDLEKDFKPPPVLTTNTVFDRDSVASSHGSRPWNNESNYPWASQQPNLEVTLPQSPEPTPPPTLRFPRFKLRIHRASTSTTGTGRLTKHRSSSDGTMSSRRSSGFFPRQNATYKLKPKPKLSISPGQVNSSHDIGNESLHTRFVESFDLPPQLNTVINSPKITLLPPSPGHEVRSFFSDDSSQARQKGSLRKRLSEFRARHSQVNLSDDARGYDRGLLSSALGKSRASGRSSRQSQNTAGAISNISHIKRIRSSVFRKVRFWWNRSEDRFKDWSYKVRSRQARNRARHVELYPGA